MKRFVLASLLPSDSALLGQNEFQVRFGDVIAIDSGEHYRDE
jgi:hypothetical protein